MKKTNSQEIQIIFEYYYQNKHAKDIQRGHSIDAQFLSRIIKKFHRNLKIRKIQNRKFLNKKKLLTLDHVEKLGSFSKNSVGIPLYISDFKQMLVKEFPSLEGISDNTISRKLKSDLKYSYQLFSKIPRKALKEETIRKMIESSLLLKKLEYTGIE